MSIPTERMTRLVEAADAIISIIREARARARGAADRIRADQAAAGQQLQSLRPDLFSDEACRDVFLIYIRGVDQLLDIVEEALRLPEDAHATLVEEQTYLRHRAKLNASNRAYAQRSRMRKWLMEHPDEDYPYRSAGRPAQAPKGDDIYERVNQHQVATEAPAPAAHRPGFVDYTDEHGQVHQVSETWLRAKAEADARAMAPAPEVSPEPIPVPADDDLPPGFEPTVTREEDPDRWAYELDRARRRVTEAQHSGPTRI